MSEVKKIIINGNEYTVSDGGAVAFDAAQGLTDEQKAQARENVNAAAVHIGADEPTDEGVTLWVDTDEEADSGSSPLTVTITDGVASHTSAEIYAHVQAGGTAALNYQDWLYTLEGCADYYASFVYRDEDHTHYYCQLLDDGSFSEYSQHNASAEDVIHTPSAGAVGQTIVVKTVGDNGEPSEWKYASIYTAEEIDTMLGSYINDIDTLLGGDS